MMAIHAKEIKSTMFNFILNLRYKTFFDKGLQKKILALSCAEPYLYCPFFIWDQGSSRYRICFALCGRNHSPFYMVSLVRTIDNMLVIKSAQKRHHVKTAFAATLFSSYLR